MKNPKKTQIYRSTNNRVLFGICAGIGEYYDIKVEIIRLIWVVVGVFSLGFAAAGYLVAALVIPEKPRKD